MPVEASILLDYSQSTVNLTEIQEQISHLPAEDRDKLSAFLVAMKVRERGEFSDIAQRLADSSQEWVDWEDAKDELGFTDDELRS